MARTKSSERSDSQFGNTQTGRSMIARRNPRRIGGSAGLFTLSNAEVKPREIGRRLLATFAPVASPTGAPSPQGHKKFPCLRLSLVTSHDSHVTNHGVSNRT